LLTIVVVPREIFPSAFRFIIIVCSLNKGFAEFLDALLFGFWVVGYDGYFAKLDVFVFEQDG